MTWFLGKTDRSRRGIAVAALMLMAAGLAACGDGSLTDANTSTALGDSDASAILTDMTGDLGLTEEQRSALEAIAQKYADRMGEPGVGWYAAADIQDVLTSEQIATIAARQEQVRDRIAARRADSFGQGRNGPGTRQRGARGGRGGPGGAGGGPWAELDLTQAQQDVIRAVMEEYRPQLEALRDQVHSGSLTREEARDQASAIRDAIRAEVEAVLTPEQLAALDDLRTARGDRAQDREEARQQARDAMTEALGLTAEQQTQIEALRDAPRAEGTRQERREAHRDAFEAILTVEQLEIVTVHDALRGHGILRRLSGGHAERGDFGQRGRGGFRGGFGDGA